jgi:polygalacturonase
MNGIGLERRGFLKSAVGMALVGPVGSVLSGCEGYHAAAKGSAAMAPALPVGGVKLNVRDVGFGATGDGKTKDTLALQLAIERCSVLGGGEVVVPAGDYLTGALTLRSGVTLRVEEGATLNGSPDMADYPFAQVRWEGHWTKGYIGFISATDAENIAIVGPGKIVGSPTEKRRNEAGTGYRNPALIEFTNCRNVRVENLSTQNFSMWSIHPVYCENVTFRNVFIKSGADGIDVDSCKHTVIDGCTFETGDDSISLKSGRGAEGNMIGRACEDTVITNCTMSDAGFACIGIGSETAAGVRGVRIEHCKFIHARSHAIFIKSRVGRGASVEDITANDLDVSGMGQGFLQITNTSTGKSDFDASVPGMAGIPLFRNFRFSNVRVLDVPNLVDAVKIDPRKPLDGLWLENISGTCKKGIELVNVKDVHLKNIAVTGYAGPLLATANVTGTGLAGAVAYDTSKLPKPLDLFAPAKAYELK